MEVLFGIIIILFVAYIATHQKFFHGKIPTWFKSLSATGLGVMIFGIGLGNSGLSLISSNIFNDLLPFVQLLLAWVGIIFGSQLKIPLLSSLPIYFYFCAFLQSILTFFALKYTFAFLISCFGALTELLPNPDLPFIFASIGCVSSPTLLAIVIRDKKVEGIGIKYLQATASLDGLIGILGFSVIFTENKISEIYQISPFLNYMMIFLISISLGLLFKAYFRLLQSQNEQFLMMIGMLTFTGGIAYSLHFSPLFVNTIIGFILCNDQKIASWIDRQFSVAERPFYLLLLLILGSHFDFSYLSADLLLFVLILVSLRVIFKCIAAKISSDLSGLKCWTLQMGLGLSYLGGISIAMVISFLTIYKDLSAQVMVTACILFFLINTVFSIFLTHLSLVNKKVVNYNG